MIMSEFTAKAFNVYVAEGKLMGNMCKNCGEYHIPPRQICSKCGSQQLEWREFKGRGVLEAVTLNKAPSTSFKARGPFSVGIVRLDEGPSISGLLSEEMSIGTRVKFTTIKDGEKTILAFEAE
jgi:uncharacterized OB-fold protein